MWRQIDHYPNYEVSTFGEVRNRTSSRILKQHVSKNGYSSIKLRNEQGSKGFRVHRLVAQAFIPNTLNKPCINHIDGNKRNNSSINLEWVTVKENNQHAYDIGIKKQTKALDTEQIKYVRENYEQGSRANGARALSRAFCVSMTTILKYVK